MTAITILLIRYKYLILFPLACIEGPILAVLCGYLIHQGTLAVIPTGLIFIAGDFVPDTIYYFIGRSIGTSNATSWLQRLFRISDVRAARFKTIWTKHVGKTVFFGKISYGLSIPVLVSAGMAHVPYKRFIAYAIPTTIFQYTVFLSLGYYVGYAATQFKGYITYIGLAIAALLLVVVGAYLFAGRYATKEIEEEVIEGK